ncbi:MAG: methyltransferase [Erythrobacter sp.]|nr:methyltransferase [Erythrobacter sp.]
MASVEIQEWQGRVGKSWATEWQRTDRSFVQLTAELGRRLGKLEIGRALDVGCGAGELSLVLARRMPDAQVLGVDVSPDLVAVANQRSAGLANVRFELADASVWRPAQDARPDLIMSRHGVMFFADPVAAFRNLHQACAPGARLMFSCFRGIEHNPFFAEVGGLLPAGAVAFPSDSHAPGPFAFADSERVERILAQAGWCDIACEPFDFAMVAGAGEFPIEDAVAYFSRIGPAARAMAGMEADERAAIQARLAGLASRHLNDGIVALGASAWIVTAARD